MGKPRACDVCSLRKIRCNGANPCLPCLKAGFDCSFAKKPLKPGPKGPRLATSTRIKKQLNDIRTSGGISPRGTLSSRPPRSVPDGHDIDPSTDGNGSSDFVPLSGVHTGPITFADVCAYLEMYHYKMYPIWPVIDRTYLLNRLGKEMVDSEQAALAFSVCAATGAQLRLDESNTPDLDPTSLCDKFAMEAESRRLTYDHREAPTMAGVLIPFFLHAYYTKKKRRYTATLYIRESVTLAQLIGLDRESHYEELSPEEAHYWRKVFWLLFVTERGHVMQYDINAILRPSIPMPKSEDDKDPTLITAFLSLARLFVAVDGTLAGAGVEDVGRVFSAEAFEALQRQLRQHPDFAPFGNEVQKTDVFVTQQWMRMLLWRLSVKKVSLTASDTESPLSLTYPAHVAKDSLAFLSRVSLDSLIAHGPGMELKIFEIANTLLDVINVVPSLSSHGISPLMQQGPRDIFHSLGCLLSSISNGKSSSLALLQSKISESTVPFTPIPRMLELNDSEQVTSPTSTGVPSGTDNTDGAVVSEWGTRMNGWVNGHGSGSGFVQPQEAQPLHSRQTLLQRQDSYESSAAKSWTTATGFSQATMELSLDDNFLPSSLRTYTSQGWDSAVT